MEYTDDVVNLMIALALGMLVGLQRQWSSGGFAGIRTFGLVALFGAVSGQLSMLVGTWMIPVGLVAAAALVITGNLIDRESIGPGQTTEFALLLMYLLGAYVVLGSRVIAVGVGTVVAVLLQLKGTFKVVVERIGEDDLKAVLQFAVISLIVLPVLPDRAMGPYAVLNPRQIWWMVVLIVGLNLLGYAGQRLLGKRRGTLLAGVLGGLISSTATTASCARTPAGHAGATRAAFAIIMLATAVVFARVLVEIAVVAPAFLRAAGPPVAILLLVAAVLGFVALRGAGDEGQQSPEGANPSRLSPALLFAGLYAAVLLAVAFAQDRMGGAGLYGVAALSGLTDMDAITLSTAELVSGGRVGESAGWRAVVIASIANLAFKAGIVVWGGNRDLAKRIGASFGVLALTAVLIVLAWPA